MKTKGSTYFWTLSVLVVLLTLFASRKFDDPYYRAINGDGKGYYAYLPAIFIYQDPGFTFVEEMETKYYPTDGSQFKDFKNEQHNGKYVNKTFPGLSILYAPFFFISMFISWIFGYPVDGYSTLFQWGVIFSHLVYFILGLRFLKAAFDRLKVKETISYLLLSGVLLGTNCWYYLAYDFTVSHIHNFFLASAFIFCVIKWLQDKNIKALGWAGIALSLMIITRPTNAVMILFIPLLAQINGVGILDVLSKQYFRIRIVFPHLIISFLLFAIPFLLWKWQSDLWLVYSYNNERFDFSKPHFFEFLFSYQKGWLLWNPLIALFLISGIIYFAKKSWIHLLSYILPILLIIYVLSSWWCWTYGAGFGQRPMIEFLPFILIGTALFLNQFNKSWILVIFLIPVCMLNLIQAFQINNSILVGGVTTRSDYWKHFLQLKTDPPKVIIPKDWILLRETKASGTEMFGIDHPYSKTIELDTLTGNKFIIKLKIGGKHKEDQLRLVATSFDGSFSKIWYLGSYVYSEPRELQFLIESLPKEVKDLKFFVWNGDSNAEGEFRSMLVSEYR